MLTGARQTGKTATQRRLFPRHRFVSLDLPSEAEQADKDPAAFFARHPPPLIIDEVQYLSDTGMLCALLNIRTPRELRQSPSAGAIWETFVFAQLRHRERRAGGSGRVFYWRDRTREVDFLVDRGGRLDLYEAKWTETPTMRDAVNLNFVLDVVDSRTVARAAIVAGASHGWPLGAGIHVMAADEL